MRFETKRLSLRPFQLEHASAMADIHQDAEVMQFSGGVQDRAATERFVGRLMSLHRAQGFGMLAVLDRLSGRLLGRAGYLVQNVDGRREVELAYLLRRDAWGHGYATEACQALLSRAFSELNFPRIISLILAANVRSVRVAERIGLRFQREVYFREMNVQMYGRIREQNGAAGSSP